MPTFEIGLRVVNPNDVELKLRGVSYTVTLAGRDVITGAGKELPVIDSYSEGTFTLTAAASFSEGFLIMTDLMKNPRDSIRYEVSTKLDVGSIMPAIRVKEVGEISLSQLR